MGSGIDQEPCEAPPPNVYNVYNLLTLISSFISLSGCLYPLSEYITSQRIPQSSVNTTEFDQNMCAPRSESYVIRELRISLAAQCGLKCYIYCSNHPIPLSGRDSIPLHVENTGLAFYGGALLVSRLASEAWPFFFACHVRSTALQPVIQHPTQGGHPLSAWVEGSRVLHANT